MGDLERAGGHRRQHRVEVERGGDRAADLFQHLQFVDGARQIPRALLDLGLQPRIGFGELAGHAVELVGELFQLVGSVHVDAMAEIAGAEPPRAGAQRGDRDQHAPRQQRAGADRNDQAEPDQERNPHQLVADRRQRLAGRLLEEHVPAELRHRACRGQHRTALGIGAGGLRPAVRLHQGRDLRQGGRILADVGSLGRACQHLALGVDHIGRGGLADLGVAKKIGEEGEVDVGNRDAGVEAGGMRHPDRHEGARAAVLDRRVADAAGHRIGEARVAGKIDLAAGHRLAARLPQLLAALAVEQCELGDGRHLAQELGVIGAVLLQAVGVGAGDPVDLALQLGHRLLDAPRGGFRLLAHVVGQRGLGGAVADVRFHRAVDREDEHHEPNQRKHVFGEQALAVRPDLVPNALHPDPRQRPQSRRGAFMAVPAKALFSTIRRPRAARLPAWLAAFYRSLPRLRGRAGWGKAAGVEARGPRCQQAV